MTRTPIRINQTVHLVQITAILVSLVDQNKKGRQLANLSRLMEGILQIIVMLGII
jgi:hypothetical protein